MKNRRIARVLAAVVATTALATGLQMGPAHAAETGTDGIGHSLCTIFKLC